LSPSNQGTSSFKKCLCKNFTESCKAIGERPSEATIQLTTLSTLLEMSQQLNNILQLISSRACILGRVCQPWSEWSEVLPVKAPNDRVHIPEFEVKSSS